MQFRLPRCSVASIKGTKLRSRFKPLATIMNLSVWVRTGHPQYWSLKTYPPLALLSRSSFSSKFSSLSLFATNSSSFLWTSTSQLTCARVFSPYFHLSQAFFILFFYSALHLNGVSLFCTSCVLFFRRFLKAKKPLLRETWSPIISLRKRQHIPIRNFLKKKS